jgi:hypothetical protein
MIFDSTPNAGGLYYFPGCGLKPKYPSLWKDCVFASGPLGNEGFRLRDYTGRTPGATWSVGAGDAPKYARGTHRGQAFWAGQYDGSNDRAITTYAPAINPSTARWTYSTWIYPLANTSDLRSFGGFLNGTNQRLYFAVDGRIGDVWAVFFGSGTEYVSPASASFAGPTNIALTLHGDTTGTLWVNGTAVTNLASIPSFTTTGAFSIGATGDGAININALIAATAFYSRVLIPSEIATLATHPLAAYAVEVPRYYLFGSTPAGNWSWLNHLRNSPYGVAQ